MIEIKNYIDEKVLKRFEDRNDLRYADLRSANLRSANLRSADLQYANLQYADLQYADLQYANLQYANLQSADLRSADLRSADLRSADLRSADFNNGTILPSGEKWELYLLEVIPTLLTAGGKTIQQILDTNCWECHEWSNCPMAIAFDISTPDEGPILLQPRIKEFIQYFDWQLIPKPIIKS